MRRWFVALFLTALTSGAAAGEFEMPTLRGSAPFVPQAPQYTRWAGFYFGGQAAYSSAHMDFSGATESLIKYMLRTTALENEQHPSQWAALGSTDTSGSSFGGFAGYNTQWEDAIVGIDVHYNSGRFFSRAPSAPITRLVSAGGNTYVATVSGDASMRITDYGAARLRLGWVAGTFMPYAALGFAVGRADVTRTATISGAENPPNGYPAVACNPLAGCTPFTFSSTESRKGAFLYGWTVGGGMDVLLTKNIFLRGEYEYIAFTKLQGIEPRLSTARFGAGVKF